MVIHVRQGKGRRDRYVMLSEQPLDRRRSSTTRSGEFSSIGDLPKSVFMNFEN